MTLDIYFGTKIGKRGSNSERKLLYNLLERNIRINKIFPEHINRDDVEDFEAMKKEGFNFYDYDIWKLAKSDGMIANVNEISFGVGYECATQALHFGKPVLALAEDCTFISGMIAQNTEPNFTFRPYKSKEQICNIIDKWLNTVEKAKKNKGKIIVIEGSDHCGKDTQISLLASYLFSRNDKTHPILTREPYGTLRPRIREILSQEGDLMKKNQLLADLFIADRKEHLLKLILPQIGKGQPVISSRYKLSTVAYQPAQLYIDTLESSGDIKFAEKKEVEFSEELIRRQEEFPEPDLTFILDIPEIERRNRASQKDLLDKFEENQELQKRVNHNYLSLWQEDEKVKRIWGVGPKEEVFIRIKGWVDQLL
ncbi:hypothetical protein HY498_02610 [Candidatus Woesearchaeota archaeon]|nr:hypothetical protein [Candidatus Woesearchaeota archaeon]